MMKEENMDDLFRNERERSFGLIANFANAKAPGYEADDFLAAAAAKEEKRRGTALVASGATFPVGVGADDHPFPGCGQKVMFN
jgi:hypothetical protein